MRWIVAFLFCSCAEVPTVHAQWAPHLTLQYAETSRGHVESRYWYRLQDRTFDVPPAPTFFAGLSAARWTLSASAVRVHDRPDLRAATAEFAVTAGSLRGVRPGFGARYAASENAAVLFTSGTTSIASASKRKLLAAYLDAGFGRYDRSHVRVKAMYGNSHLTDSLDLYVSGTVAQSPLALYSFSHSDFLGVGAVAYGRVYRFSLEGSVECYRPMRASNALPSRECVMSGGGSLLLPVWFKLGSATGFFVRVTHVDNVRPPGNQSVHFLDDSLTLGVTVRIP